MKNKYHVVCIICARGGSSGIPRKNVKEIAGKPLIAWTIEVAVQIGFMDRIVVSTDDEEIAEISRMYGAEVPILRPKHLATKKIPKIPALHHMIKYLENDGQNIDIVVDLDPTNPLKITEDINRTVDVLINHPNAESSITTFEGTHNPYWQMYENDNGYLKVSKQPVNAITCRQDCPNVYSLNSNTVVSWRNTIMNKNRHGCSGEKCIGVNIAPERSVDIDDLLQFEICEMLLNKRKI